MPGNHVRITYFPRHRFVYMMVIVYAPEPWGRMMGLQPLPPMLTDGLYAIESVPSQNIFDYIVYVRGGPMQLFLVGLPWYREAYRLADHPIFRHILLRMYGGEDALVANYHLGYSQVDLVSRNISGPITGIAYVMRDYSGAVDAWTRIELCMPPGTYRQLRLEGVYEPADWYRVTSVLPMGLVRGDPERHART